MLAHAIGALLAHDAAVAAMVADRIFTPPLPENVAYPAISFFEVSEQRAETFAGVSSLARPRIQVDVWSLDRIEMRRLSNRVRDALNGFRGPVAGADENGNPFLARIAGVMLENRQSFYEPLTKTQHGVLDFFVWNDEAQEL